MNWIKWFSGLLAALLVAALLAGLYAYVIEPGLLIVKRYALGNKTANSTLRVVQFSDVHLGESFSLERLQKVVLRINEQKPDMVVFTGDLVDVAREYRHRAEAADILARIEAPSGKFAIWGNHDYGGGGSRHYESMIADAGFTLLTNEHLTVLVAGNHRVTIDSLDDGFFGAPDYEKSNQAGPASDFTLLLTHEPDLVDNLKDYKADLILSGHSHGGQIRLPLLGALITPPLAINYVAGFYELPQGKLYVDTGIGTTRIPVRLFTPPQISVFDIGMP